MAQPAAHEDFICCVKGDLMWATRLLRSMGRDDLAIFLAEPSSDPNSIEHIRHLVVIWSRQAAESPVMRDCIALFQASHPLRKGAPSALLAFLVLDDTELPGLYRDAEVITDLRGDAPWKAPEEVPEKLWLAAIDRLLYLLGPASSSAAELLAGSQTRRRQRAPAKQAVTPAQAPDRPHLPEPVPLDEVLRHHKPFRSVRDVIENAQRLGGKAARAIPTGLLLAAIADQGDVTPSPTWAASWLRSRLRNEGNKQLLDLAKRDAAGQPGSLEIPAFTQGSAATLTRATDIARRTSGTDEIRVRHLLGALLTDSRGTEVSSALAALKDMGHEPSALCEAYFDFVRGYGDDDDEWGDILLGARVEPPVLSDFDADSDSREDQLDIKPDVMAFAGLIAARTLKPPLSIGLFGEWGSGKTFFMRRLAKQVAFLARQAREDLDKNKTRQRDQLFYRRIVQIEFNAWHYAEGNLWASLVQHIFDNLRVIDDRKRRASEELQEPILKKLKVEKAAEAQAIRERDEAGKQQEAASKALKDAKEQFERKAQELAQVSSQNVFATAPTEKVLQAIAPLLAALGFDTVIKRGVELQATLAEARAMLGRGQAAFVPLIKSRYRGLRWIFLTLALISGPLVAFVVTTYDFSNVAAATSGISVFIASCTAWLRQQMTWVGNQLTRLESAQREFDRSIEAAQADNLKKVRAAEEQLRLFEADYVAAKQREEEARRRVVEAEAKLREATVSRLLTTFIEERANSNDYRKHLGMLALIRNDFERLSDLISEENEGLEGVLKDGQDPFPSIEAELADEGQRINRIVLYIDDLDRCPPAKVVEVLQAVHLLLAFPLFVVVVGVDARWVVRSLDARYRELLKSDGKPADEATVGEFRELFGNASAHDYVEKIFQVPFWLKPMTAESSRRLVRDLLKDSVTRTEQPTTNGHKGPNQKEPSASQGASSDQRTAETQTVSPDSSPGLTPNIHSGQAPDTGGHRESPDLSPESLSIDEIEMQFVEELAPLLGRSPRTLKRFVNVYRLVRVGLSPWERGLFLSDAHGLPDYRVVLLLLAVDTGAPSIAATFLTTLRRLAFGGFVESGKGGHEKTLAPTITNLVARLDEDETVNGSPEWYRVRDWLTSRVGSDALPDDVARFTRWIDRVSRFSFHTGRLSA